jgi:uncharacterized protein YecT (DUF1311 family)
MKVTIGKRAAIFFVIGVVSWAARTQADEAPSPNNVCAKMTDSSDSIAAAICSSSPLVQLDKTLSEAASAFISTLEENGQEDLMPAFRDQQTAWSLRRGDVCLGGAVGNSDQVECLTRLYRQRIDFLNLGPDGQAVTNPNWELVLSSGDQIGVGGPSGSDYWAIVRCGVGALVIDPGGSLATTGRSVLLPSDQSTELPPEVGGLAVTGDLNETKTTCKWAPGNEAAVSFRLSRPIGEPGPCSGSFGVLMTITVNGGEIVKDRDLIGYCGAALLKSVKVDSSAVTVCTLSATDDPARNDPVTALPPVSECKTVSSQ